MAWKVEINLAMTDKTMEVSREFETWVESIGGIVDSTGAGFGWRDIEILFPDQQTANDAIPKMQNWLTSKGVVFESDRTMKQWAQNLKKINEEHVEKYWKPKSVFSMDEELSPAGWWNSLSDEERDDIINELIDNGEIDEGYYDQSRYEWDELAGKVQDAIATYQRS